jgi:hypothetical protein
MSKKMRTRLRVLLALSTADDKYRYDTLAAVGNLAPTSPLLAIPAIQASVTRLATLAVAFKVNNDTVAADRAKLALDIEEEGNTRDAVDGELLALKAAIENHATKASDLASLGFGERGASRTKGQLSAPEAIDIKSTKVRGQFTAVAREVGKSRWQYAAESSPDPVGESTWTTLTGYSRSRKVTGPSGSKVWVRFARMSGQLQSEWSTPVLVTIP